MLFTLTFSRFLGLKNTTQGAFCLNLLKKISSSWAFRDGTLPVYKQNFIFYAVEYVHAPIPVATRSKAWICSRSLARIAASNPAGGMDVFPCVVRRADPSSRGVLPSMCDTERDLVQQ